jgi:hypothetical protein
MPTVTEQPKTLYAFCPDGACYGYKTEEVQGVVRETHISYADQGSPNTPGIERSFLTPLVLSDDTDGDGHPIPAELPCPECGKPRQLSTEPRPEYPRNSNQDPMALLQLGKQEGRLRDLEHAKDLEDSERKAELAELRAQVAEMRAALAEKPARKPREAA